MTFRSTVLSTLLCFSATSSAIDIRTPQQGVFLNPTNQSKNYYDLVLHTVGIVNLSQHPKTIEAVTFRLHDQTHAVLSKSVLPSRLLMETQGLAQMSQSIPAFLNAQVLNTDGLSGWIGTPATFASSTTLDPSQVLLTTRHHFSVDFKPTSLSIEVVATDDSGERHVHNHSVPVLERAPQPYQSPLAGPWFMRSLASIESHHRLNPPTEFAVDFFKLDQNGKAHDGDPDSTQSYYGFGAPVMAVAKGVVVRVIDDVTQDRSQYLRGDGESVNDFRRRVGQYNMRRYATDFPRAAGGNLVTLRHEINGVVEFSSYGHLKAGSVAVKLGDVVEQGAVIGEVGDTGDSAAVHLHFQLNRGEDAFYSESLPVTFSNLSRVTPGADPGLHVTTDRSDP